MSTPAGTPPRPHPAPGTPEAKLASRWWRIRSSWWVLPPVLTLGIMGWLGFLVAAWRTQERRYWLAFLAYAACSVAFVAITSGYGPDDPRADRALPFWLVAMIVPTIHAAVENRRYLRVLAERTASYEIPPAPAPGAPRP